MAKVKITTIQINFIVWQLLMEIKKDTKQSFNTIILDMLKKQHKDLYTKLFNE